MRVLGIRRVRNDVGLRQLQAAVSAASHKEADGVPDQDSVPHQDRPDALPVQSSIALSNSTPHGPNKSPDRLPDEKDESARPVAQPDEWKPDAVSDFVADEDADIEPHSDAN